MNACSKCGEPFYENERLRRELRLTQRTLDSVKRSQRMLLAAGRVRLLPLYTMDTVHKVAR